MNNKKKKFTGLVVMVLAFGQVVLGIVAHYTWFSGKILYKAKLIYVIFFFLYFYSPQVYNDSLIKPLN